MVDTHRSLNKIEWRICPVPKPSDGDYHRFYNKLVNAKANHQNEGRLTVRLVDYRRPFGKPLTFDKNKSVSLSVLQGGKCFRGINKARRFESFRENYVDWRDTIFY